MTDVSVIVPARNEKYLQQTIDSVLANAEGDTEIVVVLDGCWPYEPVPDHPRVNIVHHSEARGQRQSINEAARIARGRFLMKLDAHCAVGPGFDRILMEDWRPGWTLVPRMYNLDVETFQPKLHKVTDYMYAGWNEKDELRALYYTGREWKRQHARTAEVDETMCCMGPGWFLSAEDFWCQGGCDEGHGSWGQQGIEVSFKAWLSGGALMVDKRTWFAHWFRAKDGGFPYPISQRSIDRARAYSKDLWLNNGWPGQTRTIQWLVERFEPPGWEGRLAGQEDREKTGQLNAALYEHIHRRGHEPRWRGVRVVKQPGDLILYHEVIWQSRPRWIVECGTKFGGSASFLQDMLDLVGEGGRVLTIDIDAKVENPDPRICYVQGSSTDAGTVSRVKETVGGEPCMVVLDSNHARVHVKWELYHYAPLVTPGQYLVVEDCYSRGTVPFGPLEARDWFLRETREGRRFENMELEKQFLIGVTNGGWLRRKG